MYCALRHWGLCRNCDKSLFNRRSKIFLQSASKRHVALSKPTDAFFWVDFDAEIGKPLPMRWYVAKDISACSMIRRRGVLKACDPCIPRRRIVHIVKTFGFQLRRAASKIFVGEIQ